MANIPVNKIFGEYIYAKGRVNKYGYPGGPVIGTVENGKLIGTVYSYNIYNGKVYWMINSIYANQPTFFVEHNPSALNLPNKQQILNDIAKEAEAKELQDKGIIQYNIDKYLPYIVGGAIAIAALPTILQTGSKINGMKNNKKDNLKTLLLIGGAAALLLYRTKKKTKAGKPIIEVIDEGFAAEQLEPAQTASSGIVIQDSFGNISKVDAIVPAATEAELTTVYSGGGNGGYLDFVGPFKADYVQPAQTVINGQRTKGDLGALRTC